MEELKLLKEIIGDLSGMGIWIMSLYVLVKALGYAGLVYIGDRIVRAAVSVLKTDMSKQEARELDDKNHELKREMEDVKAKAKREVEEVKHLYKILKESNQ